MNLRPRQAIPLADAAAMNRPARRLRVIRSCLRKSGRGARRRFLRSAPRQGRADLVKGADSGVVVLDLSASIGKPGRQVTDPFEYLADTGQEFGMVIFSGRAYEMLPPGTSSTELRPIIRRWSRSRTSAWRERTSSVRRTPAVSSPTRRRARAFAACR